MKYLCNLFLSLVAAFSFNSNVNATDTYNSLNGQLNIPAVAVGDTVYTNVVITIKSILGVGGSNADSSYVPKNKSKIDSYDQLTNQLSIPSVEAFGAIYYDVVITVESVLAVESQKNIISFYDNWALNKLRSVGSISTTDFAPIKEGHFDLLAVGDLNGDGYDDLVIGPKVITASATNFEYVKLIIAFYNPASKSFEPDAVLQSKLPSMQFSHKAHIFDFNKDGKNDLFVSGTGPDQGQPCGERSVLMLGSNTGLVDASNLLPGKSAYTHQMVFGDFDKDTYNDIYMLNNSWIPDGPSAVAYCNSYIKYPSTLNQFLISTKSWVASTPKYNDPMLGSILGEFVGNYTSATSGDFDDDGNMDVAVYGENGIKGYVIVMFGDGKGDFVRSTRLLVQPFGKGTVSGSMSAKDLDGDGIPEIVINTAEQTTQMGWQGSAFSVLKYQKQDNSLIDVSPAYFTKNIFMTADSEVVFCSSILWRDLNGDGKDDLICSVLSAYRYNDSQSSPRIFINKSNGKFEPAYHSGFDIIGVLGSMFPIKIDGVNKIVGIGNAGRNVSIQLAE